MTLKTIIAAGCGVAFLAVCGATPRNEAIERIMEKGFKKDGLRHQINAEVSKDAPDWAGALKKSKEFQALCDQLTKQSPPKGDTDSWKTHTQTVLAEAKSLSECVEKKDQSKAKQSVKKINESCKACHDAHRE